MDKDSERERIRLAESAYRHRNYAMGLKHAKIWVHAEDIDLIKAYAKNLLGVRGIVVDQRRNDATTKPTRETRSIDDILKRHRSQGRVLERELTKDYKPVKRR